MQRQNWGKPRKRRLPKTAQAVRASREVRPTPGDGDGDGDKLTLRLPVDNSGPGGRRRANQHSRQTIGLPPDRRDFFFDLQKLALVFETIERVKGGFANSLAAREDIALGLSR